MSDLDDLLLGQAYAWILILIITFISSMVLIGIYYRFDRYDPEPLSQIFVSFVIGALVPVLSVPVLVFSTYGLHFIFMTSHPLIEIVFLAPIIEELSKGLALFLLLQKMEIDSPFDAFLYGVSVGTGFAFVENIVYGMRAFFSSGISEAITLTFLRSSFAIIGHPVYTAIFGFGIGAHRVGIKNIDYHNMQKSILLHMAWNFTFILPLTTSLNPGIWFAFALIIISVTIFVVYDLLLLALKIEVNLHEEGYFDKKRRYRIYVKES